MSTAPTSLFAHALASRIDPLDGVVSSRRASIAEQHDEGRVGTEGETKAPAVPFVPAQEDDPDNASAGNPYPWELETDGTDRLFDDDPQV